MTSEIAKDSLERYWQERTLCSDEACIGVIGPDGRCKECGKPYAPDKQAPADRKQDSVPASSESCRANENSNDPAIEEGNLADDNYWRERTLCSDEACIGVIGPDGRCKECGKPFKSEQ